MNRPDSNSPDQSANRDDDAVWLDLVSRLEATSSDPRPVADRPQSPAAVPPESEEVSKSLFGDFDPLGLAAPVEKSAPERGGETDGRAKEHLSEGTEGPEGPRDYEVEDDGGFVPDEPPSLAGAEPLSVLSWLGAVGGPVALLLAVMFWRTAPLGVILGIVAIFIASVVYLIMKLPEEKDDNDDGARV